MSDLVVSCPKCKHKFQLAESLRSSILTEAQEGVSKQHSADLARMQKESDDRVAAAKAAAETAAATESRRQIDALRDDLRLSAENNAKMSKELADLLRERRQLTEEKATLELTVERRVQAETGTIREEAAKAAEERSALRLAERETQIRNLGAELENLRRKAEQGSQQGQGETFEESVEDTLTRAFTTDSIVPVAKGVTGGDITQHVKGNGPGVYGSILWELKRTKTWSDGWLTKLRADQRASGADCCVIVSHVLPKGVADMDIIDGVVVISPKMIIPAAKALRQMLINVWMANRASQDATTKADRVYAYMTGKLFRQRMSGLIEVYTSLMTSLDAEQRALTTQLQKRRVILSGMVEQLAKLFGDVQGIAGESIAELPELSLAAIGDGK